MTRQIYTNFAIPKDLADKMATGMKGEGFSSRIEYVKHLIRKDLEKKRE